MNLPPNYQEAIDQFLKTKAKDSDVLAILLFGSLLYQKPEKNTDVDIVVITKENKYITADGKYTHWIFESKLYNNIPFEILIRPIGLVNYYLENQIGKRIPTIAFWLVDSIILFQNGDEIDELIAKAKKIVKVKRPKITKYDMRWQAYVVDDYMQDIEDAYLRKDIFTFNIIYFQLLANISEIFACLKREYTEKTKRLEKQLKLIDKKFGDLYSKCATETDFKKRYKLINQLVPIIEKGLGGKNKKEWKILRPVG